MNPNSTSSDGTVPITTTESIFPQNPSGLCPNCGRCPHCGKSNWPQPICYPSYYPTYYVGGYPYTTCAAGNPQVSVASGIY